MNKKAYSETSVVQRISALLCLYWWNLTWSHHLATARPKWVNTIRIAFLMSRCSSFNVSASKVEPIMEQLTNHSWIGTKTVQFPIKHTWCIQLHAVNWTHIHLFAALFCSGSRVVAPCTDTRQKYGWRTARKERYPLFHERLPSAPSCTMPGIVTALPGLLNIATSEC